MRRSKKKKRDRHVNATVAFRNATEEERDGRVSKRDGRRRNATATLTRQSRLETRQSRFEKRQSHFEMRQSRFETRPSKKKRDHHVNATVAFRNETVEEEERDGRVSKRLKSNEISFGKLLEWSSYRIGSNNMPCLCTLWKGDVRGISSYTRGVL